MEKSSLWEQEEEEFGKKQLYWKKGISSRRGLIDLMGNDPIMGDGKGRKLREWWRKVKNLTYEDVVVYMYRPTDPSSLGVIRFLFGLLMLSDLPEERGGADIDVRWGDPRDCHFPLFPIMKVPPFHIMSLLYLTMWIGAFGIMLGYKFRISTLLFGIPYWYILLLDKSFWNNHSYLFGVVTILLMGTSANHFFSMDGYLDESKRNKDVPYWNYFILKFQFFMLYFLAGLKKTDMEWLDGYSMSYLGDHWVFSPFKIDYFVVHWFGFLLDLTIGFWMILEFSRPVAMVFCASFHLMNSRLFSIGMFPYVCLATMPLFCEESWPRKLGLFARDNPSPSPSPSCIYPQDRPRRRHKFVVALLMLHCGLQGFLPYSHFITKGYNNWTDGLYGYSWDMMVHSWDTVHVLIRIVDNNSSVEYFVDPTAFTQNDRWNKHSDMLLQYANCLKDNILEDHKHDLPGDKTAIKSRISSENISIYVDVWCSLNKRFQQRMYDPNCDLLRAKWSPFERVEWLLPVLTEYNDFRGVMDRITQEVYSWSNYSDVLFFADFPGLTLENFINKDFNNVTLTVLEGEVLYEVEDGFSMQSIGKKLKKGENFPVESGDFHKIHTISSVPSCYMYTYTNEAKQEENSESSNRYAMYSPFPLIEDFGDRIESFSLMWEHIFDSVLYVLFRVPYQVRSKANGD